MTSFTGMQFRRRNLRIARAQGVETSLWHHGVLRAPISALQNYKTAKEVSKVKEEKNKALDEVLTKLKALEKEIEEIQKK